ncbi:hypothetical protein ACFSCX_13030 [Bacillus salitolerans]|uniref:DNA-binding protein n=1 Tax=Bacillus salitolerans TaxID=1437434 RepID=A0ABW4LR04_9BACI
MNKYLSFISIIVLSLSIVYLGYQVGQHASNREHAVSEKQEVKKIVPFVDKGLWTLEETAQYLSIPVEELERTILKQDVERNKQTSFSTYEYIPYITLNQKRYFNKNDLDEWIRYNSLRWNELK